MNAQTAADTAPDPATSREIRVAVTSPSASDPALQRVWVETIWRLMLTAG